MNCEAAWQVKMINDRTERIAKVRRHVALTREDGINTCQRYSKEFTIVLDGFKRESEWIHNTS